MRLINIFSIIALFGTTSMLHAAAPAASTTNGAEPPSRFSVSDQTEIPGVVLPPGNYSIRVVDHLSDRIILRVDATGGTTHATFLGLSNASLVRSSQGAIPWNAGPDGKAALRGYAFPNGTVVEFVYPKAEAVSLAKLNANKVPAIDPASEGRVAEPSLSKGDMELVTLWMLSPTPVGPGDPGPGIKAERYQQHATNVKPKPIMASLPHTASYLPLCWAIGLLSFGGAALLRLRVLYKSEYGERVS